LNRHSESSNGINARLHFFVCWL